MAIDRSTVNTVFGKVLKGVARENDKTQQAIADHLGQNVVTINRIFGGKRDITVSQFFQIAEFCGEDPAVILDRVTAKLKAMSGLPDNVTRIRGIEAMAPEEREALGVAAVRDRELEHDEPDPT